MRDEAARQIWDRFAQRLSALVRRRLNPKIRVREDENDVVQSMFQSFFAVQQNQGYPLKNREELWRFLVGMTMCKVANVAHHHQRTRRDIRREQSLAPSEGAGDFSASVIAGIADLSVMSPAGAAISRIELARTLRRLQRCDDDHPEGYRSWRFISSPRTPSSGVKPTWRVAPIGRVAPELLMPGIGSTSRVCQYAIGVWIFDRRRATQSPQCHVRRRYLWGEMTAAACRAGLKISPAARRRSRSVRASNARLSLGVSIPNCSRRASVSAAP